MCMILVLLLLLFFLFVVLQLHLPPLLVCFQLLQRLDQHWEHFRYRSVQGHDHETQETGLALGHVARISIHERHGHLSEALDQTRGK